MAHSVRPTAVSHIQTSSRRSAFGPSTPGKRSHYWTGQILLTPLDPGSGLVTQFCDVPGRRTPEEAAVFPTELRGA